MTNSQLENIESVQNALQDWALNHAFTLWHRIGVDPTNGAFYEKVGQTETPQNLPRRARVTPRQIYCFCMAGKLGWDGPWRDIVKAGTTYFFNNFFRVDGFVRSLIGADGSILDDEAVLYDQAFALFALANIQSVMPEFDDPESRAKALLVALRQQQSSPLGGFKEFSTKALPLLSNPHMHLLEATLEWAKISKDPIWQQQANEIAELCLKKFIDPEIGCVREYFDGEWAPQEGIDGQKFEPGHQYEWGWLLLRWGQSINRPDAIEAALKMIGLAEEVGIDHSRGVAYNVMLKDLSIYDLKSRLWPQTERIKACLLAAELTRDYQYLQSVIEGAKGLNKYLATPIKGLWYDTMTPSGELIAEDAPASSFYHVICSIVELDNFVRRL